MSMLSCSPGSSLTLFLKLAVVLLTAPKLSALRTLPCCSSTPSMPPAGWEYCTCTSGSVAPPGPKLRAGPTCRLGWASIKVFRKLAVRAVLAPLIKTWSRVTSLAAALICTPLMVASSVTMMPVPATIWTPPDSSLSDVTYLPPLPLKVILSSPDGLCVIIKFKLRL